MNLKHWFIIAGCNGAGKTTASYTILPDILLCDQFVNVDQVVIFDNSSLDSTIVAEKLLSSELQIYDSYKFNQLLKHKNETI